MQQGFPQEFPNKEETTHFSKRTVNAWSPNPPIKSKLASALSSFIMSLVKKNIELGVLRGNAGAVLMVMAKYANASGERVFASNKTIGGDMNPSRSERQVQRGKAELRDAGWLVEGGSFTSHGYTNKVWNINLAQLYRCDPLNKKTPNHLGRQKEKKKPDHLERQKDEIRAKRKAFYLG